MIGCPVCKTTAEPAAQAGPIAICSGCGSTLAIDAAGGVTRATARDTNELSMSELVTLKRAKAKVKAAK